MPSKYDLPGKVHAAKRLLPKFYETNGESVLLELVNSSRWRIIEETDYDNWNGGTYGHDLIIYVPEELFLRIFEVRESLEKKISEDITKIVRDVPNEYLNRVAIDIPPENPHLQKELDLYEVEHIDSCSITRIWINNWHLKAFISHKVSTKNKAHDMKQQLWFRGVSAFVAHDSIVPDEEWQNEIEMALVTMDVMIVLLTEDFHDSKWTDQEIGFALGRKVPVIALNLGLDPYGFIGKLQSPRYDWQNDFNAARYVHDRILKNKLLNSKAHRAIIESLRYSSSYQMSTTLANIIYWDRMNLTEDELQVLDDALHNNVQVSGACNAVSNIKSILKRHGYLKKKEEEDNDFPF